LEGGTPVEHDAQRGSKLGGQSLDDPDERADAARRCAQEEQLPRSALVVDHGEVTLEPSPPPPEASMRARSVSMTDRSTSACCRARVARASHASTSNPSVRPWRCRSVRKAPSSSKAKTAAHIRPSSAVSLLATISLEEYVWPTRHAKVT